MRWAHLLRKLERFPGPNYLSIGVVG